MTVSTPQIVSSPVSCSIDLEGDGVRHGFLTLPYSSDAAAWGSVMTPISVIANGDGPTAILFGGNHGDEYEGQVALRKLAATLEASEVAGRIIIVPSLNLPAARAGRRTSPLDGGNFNRAFPGRPDGTPTQKMADYVLRHILPLGDLVVDLHSGGRTLDFLPLAASHELPDKAQETRCRAARDAFRAPFSMQMVEMDGGGMLDTEVEAMGATFVTTELAGGGTLTRRSLAVADQGLRNVLVHAGVLAGGTIVGAPSIELAMPDDCFIVSDAEGLIEPCADLGDWVQAGQPVARIWDITRSGAAPRDYPAHRDGLLVGRHFPGLVRMGDCLAAFALPVGEDGAARLNALRFGTREEGASGTDGL